jgi:hypothetical protein
MISARISPRWLSTCTIGVHVLLLSLLSQETFGFAPTNYLHATNSGIVFASSPSSLESPTETSTSAWIQQEIESHKIKGEEVIDSQCVVGPKHVLIYDTTLRGTSL